MADRSWQRSQKKERVMVEEEVNQSWRKHDPDARRWVLWRKNVPGSRGRSRSWNERKRKRAEYNRNVAKLTPDRQQLIILQINHNYRKALEEQFGAQNGVHLKSYLEKKNQFCRTEKQHDIITRERQRAKMMRTLKSVGLCFNSSCLNKSSKRQACEAGSEDERGKIK